MADRFESGGRIDRRYAITVLGGGRSDILLDTDLWGLQSAVNHALQDGYLKDNEDWGRGMLDRIRRLRDSGEES